MTSFKFLWNKLIYINYHLSWTSCNQSQSLNEMWGRYHFKVYLIQQVSRYMALFTLWSVWSPDKISIWPLYSAFSSVGICYDLPSLLFNLTRLAVLALRHAAVCPHDPVVSCYSHWFPLQSAGGAFTGFPRKMIIIQLIGRSWWQSHRNFCSKICFPRHVPIWRFEGELRGWRTQRRYFMSH